MYDVLMKIEDRVGNLEKLVGGGADPGDRHASDFSALGVAMDEGYLVVDIDEEMFRVSRTRHPDVWSRGLGRVQGVGATLQEAVDDLARKISDGQ